MMFQYFQFRKKKAYLVRVNYSHLAEVMRMRRLKEHERGQ